MPWIPDIKSTMGGKRGGTLFPQTSRSTPEIRSESLPSLSQTASSLSLPRSESAIPVYSSTLVQGPSAYDLPSKADVIIAVMGPTGAGKTTFVNKAAGIEETGVGHGLNSCTQTIEVTECYDEDQSRRVILVDTPGFDDTTLSDLDILKIIADWLQRTYQNDIKLSGLLYLHRISDNRMAGTPLRLLKTFQNLCGDHVLDNVILVTTMWDEVTESTGEEREKELYNKYWNAMITAGSRTSRFHNSRESAWDILSQFRGHAARPVLLQRELVDQGLALTETTAGKTLFSWLIAFMKKFRKALKRIENKLKNVKNSDERSTLSRKRVETADVLEQANAVHRRYSSPAVPQRAPSMNVLPNSIPPPAIPSSSAPVPSRSESLDDCASPPPSPAEPIVRPSSNRQILQGTITALKLGYQLAGLSPLPGFQGVIGLVLNITEMIEKMPVVDNSLVHLAQRAGFLTVTIVELTGVGDISDGLKPAIDGFVREMNQLWDIIKELSLQTKAKRFLSNHGMQVIEDCNRQIAFACEVFGIQLGLFNYQAIVRIEATLKTLVAASHARRTEPPLDPDPPRRVPTSRATA